MASELIVRTGGHVFCILVPGDGASQDVFWRGVAVIGGEHGNEDGFVCYGRSLDLVEEAILTSLVQVGAAANPDEALPMAEALLEAWEAWKKEHMDDFVRQADRLRSAADKLAGRRKMPALPSGADDEPAPEERLLDRRALPRRSELERTRPDRQLGVGRSLEDRPAGLLEEGDDDT